MSVKVVFPGYTHQDLDECARRHVPYEITQLVGTAMMLYGRGAVTAPLDSAEVLRNALLESFLIHLRSLDDFLGTAYNDRKKAEDVLAVDLVSSWPAESFLDRDVRIGVNAQLAHLSTKRVAGPEHPWRVMELAALAINKLLEFHTKLDEANASQSREWADAIGSALGRARDLVEETPEGYPWIST